MESTSAGDAPPASASTQVQAPVRDSNSGDSTPPQPATTPTSTSVSTPLPSATTTGVATPTIPTDAPTPSTTTTIPPIPPIPAIPLQESAEAVSLPTSGSASPFPFPPPHPPPPMAETAIDLTADSDSDSPIPVDSDGVAVAASARRERDRVAAAWRQRAADHPVPSSSHSSAFLGGAGGPFGGAPGVPGPSALPGAGPGVAVAAPGGEAGRARTGLEDNGAGGEGINAGPGGGPGGDSTGGSIASGSAAASAAAGGEEKDAQAQGDSDGDDFVITASTGPTRPFTARMRGAGPGPGPGGIGARTQGTAASNNSHSASSAGAGGSLLSPRTHGHGQGHGYPSPHQHFSSHHHHNTHSHSHSHSSSHSALSQSPFAHLIRNNSNSSGSSPNALAAAAASNFYRNHPANFAPGTPNAFGSLGSGSGTSTPGTPSVPSLPSSLLGSSSIPGVPSLPSLPSTSFRNGHGHSSNGLGDGSAAAPIDVDKVVINPNPPRTMSRPVPICIGGFMSRAIMLYPKLAVTTGEPTPAGSPEMWEVVNYRGVEMLRVKLKLRKAGSMPRPDEPWSATNVDTIQVMTPAMSTYIGDLDAHTAEVLIPMLKRGLCRLEGFAVRLPKETAQYECKINVMIFTLPSNVRYIADTLLAHSLFLLDPLPPYDPTRHTDCPEYQNAHGSGERAMQMYQAHRRAQQSTNGGQVYNPAMDKARQVEVQRKQAEAILDELADGVELEQSDPGPWIRTELFPHQRKALTFLLQGEQDTKSLKEARKIADRKLGKTAKKDGSEGATDRSDKEGTAGPKEGKEKDKDKDSKLDFSRSLWEGERDDRGRLRIWKNKVTGEKMRLKKNERPQDAKGAILADDMGLGKTLSVVSLIAATRFAAKEWAAKPLEPVPPIDAADKQPESKLDASSMMTKVFGMPDPDAELVNGSKKRRRDADEPSEKEIQHRIRRSRIVKRAKGTLLVCPMSTMTNWEDQIKEHWDGKVVVVGGAGSSSGVKSEAKNGSAEDKEFDEYDTIKVYIYHGAQRNMDPRFLAEFDIVITSYSTLANEYSKQCATCGDEEGTPLETGAANSDDEGTPGVVADSSVSSRGTATGTKTPDTDFKPSELSDLLRKKGKAKKKPLVPSGEQPSALQSIDWFRVVLDEAHSIKSASTIACRASCALEADRRIALTGTPIQNRVDDVWALFKFLRMSPINEREVFTKYITNPCKTGEQVGVARLQLVMRTCTLRRTKDTMSESGRKILDLPPRREIQIWLDLREDERKIYDERHDEIKKDIMELQAKKQLTKNYAHVLQHLLRLRQTCDHVDLPNSGPVEEDYDGTIMDYELACQGIEKYGLSLPRAQSVLSFNKDTPDGAVCAECGHDFGPLFPSIGLGGAEDEPAKSAAEIEGKKGKKPLRPVLTKCLHVMCPPCFKRSVHTSWPKRVAGVTRQCGVCEKMLRLDLDAIEVTPPNSDEPEDQPKKVVRRKKWTRKDGEDLSLSSKMEWLREELMRHSKLHPGSANYDFFPFDADRSMPYTDAEGNPFDSINLDEDGNPIPSKGIIFSQWTTMLDRIEDMLRELKINYCRLDGTMTREQRAQAMDDLRTKKSVEVMLVSTRAGGVGLNLTSACRAYLVDPYWNPSVEAQAIDRVHRMGQKYPVTAVRLMIKKSVEEKLDAIQKKKASLAQLSLKNMTRKELMEQKAEELATLFS